MSEHHILENVAPGLLAPLRELPLDQRRQMLAEACQQMSRTIANLEPELQDWVEVCFRDNVLPGSQLERVRAFAEMAEDRDITFQKEHGHGRIISEWFEKARLATAIVNGFGGTSWKDTADAVYELSVLRKGDAALDFIQSKLNVQRGSPMARKADVSASIRPASLISGVSGKLVKKLTKILRPPAADTRKELERLFPILVPRYYCASGNWPGPLRMLEHPALALTWVTLEPRQTMLYVTHAQAESWEKAGIDYHARGIENLKSATGKQLATRSKLAEDGSAYYIIMQQADGLGSSRVLLREELLNCFPDGYFLAVPERSVAIAVSQSAPKTVVEEVKTLAAKWAKVGSVPMLSDLFTPDALTS